MIQYKRIIGTICLGAALLTLSGCGGASAETKPVQKQIFAMDTVMDLTAYGSNGEKALEAAVQEAVRVLTALIRENQSHLDEYKGILVERYWELLDKNN